MLNASILRITPVMAAAAALLSASSVWAGSIEPQWVNETGFTSEADYCNLQFPASITINVGTSTPIIYGRIFEASMTPPAGANPSIVGQVGYGPLNSNPTTASGWLWFPTTFNIQLGNDDEYQGSFVPATPGTFSYTYRFKLNALTSPPNEGWTACDLNGAGSNAGLTFDTDQQGLLTVIPEPASIALLGLGAFLLRRRKMV